MKFALFQCVTRIKTNNSFTSQTFDEQDEYPKVTQSDLDRAKFRVGFKPTPRKQRVTILLDAVMLEYFKTKANDRGHQTSINDTLRKAMKNDLLEDRLRRSIREELQALAA